MRFKLMECIFFFIYLFSISGSYAANGATRKDDSFPYLVQLGYKANNFVAWVCAGCLLNPNTVITTSNCINIKPFGSPSLVRNNYGEEEIKSYVTSGDVARLFLKKAFEVKEFLCFSSKNITLSGIAVGWGGLSFDNQLHASTNKEISTVGLSTIEIFEDTIKMRVTSKSKCVADRGGPLLIRSDRTNCQYEVFGILKDWKHCGEENSFGEYKILNEI